MITAGEKSTPPVRVEAERVLTENSTELELHHGAYVAVVTLQGALCAAFAMRAAG
jgi:hypothetical protein